MSLVRFCSVAPFGQREFGGVLDLGRYGRKREFRVRSHLEDSDIIARRPCCIRDPMQLTT